MFSRKIENIFSEKNPITIKNILADFLKNKK